MGMVDGLILAAIFNGIFSLEFKRQLNECRLSEVPEGAEVYCYKGEIYDREKFALLKMSFEPAA